MILFRVAAVCLIFSAFTSQAQVKIGLPAGAADNSAVLDVSNKGGGNKGFLAPQVALTALNAAGPVTAPAAGLLVYNTATAGTSPNNVAPGYYYWNGTQWVAIITATSTTSDGNIYSSDGTLTGARTVTQAGNPLNFTGGEISFTPSSVTTPLFIKNGWTTTNPRLITTDTMEFQSGGNHYQLALLPNGYVGVNTTAPTATLDVNGSARIGTIAKAVNGAPIGPLYADPSGNILRSPGSSTLGSYYFDTSLITQPNNTGFLTTSFQDGGIYKAIVSTGDACSNIALAEYYIVAFSSNGFWAINGLGGIIAGGGINKTPNFTQIDTHTISTTWGSYSGCADGSNSTGFNFTLALSYSAPTFTLNVTPNGNVQRIYYITLIRMN